MSGVEAAEPPAAPVAAVLTPEDATDRPEPVIRTRRLTKKYGTLTAVNKLDLEVYPGEIFGLLGQNGAGKTTTILMLLGLSEPTGGEAWVMGLDPAWEPREVKRRVGYLPDSVGFYDDLTGRQNLRYTARLNGLRRDEAEQAIDEVLEQVGLTSRANDPVEQYSRGMLQRLGIADALVKSPDLLILDEPTTSIDPLGVIEILELLRRLVTERGLSIMLSSHLLTQVQSVCDRIGIFAAGRLIGVGTVDQLAAQFGDGTATIEVGLELPTAADADRAASALGGLASVESVEPPAGVSGTGTWRIHVRPASAEASVRQEILVAAVKHGLRLTALRPVVPSLDEIYRLAVERPIPKRTGVKRRRSARAGAERGTAERATAAGAVGTEVAGAARATGAAGPAGAAGAAEAVADDGIGDDVTLDEAPR